MKNILIDSCKLAAFQTSFRRKLSSATIVNYALKSSSVEVEFSLVADATRTKQDFNNVWLFDNSDLFKSVANQKKPRSINKLLNTVIESAKIYGNGKRISFSSSIGEFGLSSEFLLAHSSQERKGRDSTAQKLTCYSFSEMYENGIEEKPNKAAFQNLLKSLYTAGIVVLKGVPCKNLNVLKVGLLFGKASHDIYGEFFDVKAKHNPINVAYTDMGLELHQDLAYFESIPGLQLLHALEFPVNIVGGESTFLDVLNFTENFKINHPKHFEILTAIPATFQKFREDVTVPLAMYYRRPHIVTNHLEEVISVFWSPPFEGPLQSSSGINTESYYQAYACFQNEINSEESLKKFGYSFRLQTGDLVIFNNKKILHGRKAFKRTKEHERHLQGCYIGIDDYLNTLSLNGFDRKIKQGVLEYTVE